MSDIALELKNFCVYYDTSRGPAKAANNVSFSLMKGEKLGLVGESGCGKTTTILGIIRLIKYPARIAGGSILLDGHENLTALSEKKMRKVRFHKISLIPQGAMNSLNPTKKIYKQFYDIYQEHDSFDFKSQDEAKQKISDLLSFVGLKKSVMTMYPHELSGGMKQRVCIAMAISLGPQVILADEPTSALDVVVQRQVMATLDMVQKELNSSIILIGHDMGLMAQFVDRIAVMYAGRIVELAPVRDIFKNSLHPYTQFLIHSIPSLEKRELFKGIPGAAPSLLDPPAGCPFHPRCPRADKKIGCMDACPDLLVSGMDRHVACHAMAEDMK